MAGMEADPCLEHIEFAVWDRPGPAGLVDGSLAAASYTTEVEVRWLRDGTGFRLWKISGALEEVLSAGERRCTPLGSYDEKRERFVESNLTADLTGRSTKGKRAARRKVPPERPALSEGDRVLCRAAQPRVRPAWSGSEARLNQPRVVAAPGLRVWIQRGCCAQGRWRFKGTPGVRRKTRSDKNGDL